MLAGFVALFFLLGCMFGFYTGLKKRSWKLVVASLLFSEVALLLLQLLAIRQFASK
jgi:hypothetical protein